MVIKYIIILILRFKDQKVVRHVQIILRLVFHLYQCHYFKIGVGFIFMCRLCRGFDGGSRCLRILSVKYRKMSRVIVSE
jgi:hypothetical protein